MTSAPDERMMVSAEPSEAPEREDLSDMSASLHFHGGKTRISVVPDDPESFLWIQDTHASSSIEATIGLDEEAKAALRQIVRAWDMEDEAADIAAIVDGHDAATCLVCKAEAADIAAAAWALAKGSRSKSSFGAS